MTYALCMVAIFTSVCKGNRVLTTNVYHIEKKQELKIETSSTNHNLTGEI